MSWEDKLPEETEEGWSHRFRPSSFSEYWSLFIHGQIPDFYIGFHSYIVLYFFFRAYVTTIQNLNLVHKALKLYHTMKFSQEIGIAAHSCRIQVSVVCRQSIFVISYKVKNKLKMSHWKYLTLGMWATMYSIGVVRAQARMQSDVAKLRMNRTHLMVWTQGTPDEDCLHLIRGDNAHVC